MEFHSNDGDVRCISYQIYIPRYVLQLRKVAVPVRIIQQ